MTFRSLASRASPKDTILVSFWTPELESSGPEDQEPGTGTGSLDLTRRGPVARRISCEGPGHSIGCSLAVLI